MSNETGPTLAQHAAKLLHIAYNQPGGSPAQDNASLLSIAHSVLGILEHTEARAGAFQEWIKEVTARLDALDENVKGGVPQDELNG